VNESTLTLAEAWNGTSWAAQHTPSPTNPPTPALDTLNGVSCASPAACTAVGYYYNSSGVMVALAERWDGTSWAMQAIPGSGPFRSCQPVRRFVSHGQ
jgi:hypothetical protein